MVRMAPDRSGAAPTADSQPWSRSSRTEPHPRRSSASVIEPTTNRYQRLSPGRERAVRGMFVLATVVGLAYLGWRLAFTLNPEAMTFSILLWVAEAWTLVTALMLFVVAWEPFHREPPPPPPPGRSVDVFVPTLNEPVWIVRRTLIGAIAIDYPHKTWLLDDADRPEMRELAAELGVGYLPREGSEGAKAGHINAAMAETDGEFIVLLDADHVAVPTFLDETLGYFEDELVAFVQTPQEFYNVDSFEHDLDRRQRQVWHEQTLFYRLIQPGKDRWNASFFCGSSGVLRRAAIEDVGGFPEETITEDIHLSILIHAAGWKSVFQRKPLAFGLSPQTAVAFQTQRLRWGQGGMQVLKKANPLTLRGLSPMQRVNYMASMLPWFDGWQKLVFYAAPPVFLFSGVLPIQAHWLVFAAAFLVTYTLLLTATKLGARGTAKLMLSDSFSAASFATNIKATLGLFTRKRLKFAVTDKEGQARVPVRVALGPLLVILVTTIAVAVGTFRFVAGFEDRALAYWVNIFWSALNAGILGYATWRMLATRERREVHRFWGDVPVEWWSPAGTAGLAIMEDVSEGGARLRVQGDIPDGQVRVRLWPSRYQILTGDVAWRREAGDGHVVGLSWRTQAPWGQPGDMAATGALFLQPRLLHALETPADGRPSPLLGMDREALVPFRHLEGDQDVGVLQQTGPRGAQVEMISPLRQGQRVRIAPWDGDHVWRATVADVHRFEFPPFRVYTAELVDLVKDGSRVPGMDPPAVRERLLTPQPNRGSEGAGAEGSAAKPAGAPVSQPTEISVRSSARVP
jgi:cellulose synthase (UDP-forming)